MSFPFSRTLGAGIHIISTSDCNIQCDTSLGAVNLVLPKISELLNQISRQGYSVGAVGIFSLYITDISNNAFNNNITIITGSGDSFSNNIPSVVINTNNGSVAIKPISETSWNVLTSISSSPLTLTTTGTSGAASLVGYNLNIPIYQPQIAFSTTGTSGASSFDGTNLNIPIYQPQIAFSTTGTSGASSFDGTNLNIPIYQSQITLTTNGTSGASTFNGTTLNIPIYTPSTNYGVFAQTANSTPITATITEGTLIDGGVGTLSVPANGFSVGDSFQANFGGLMSAKNNDTITIRVKSGGVILADSGALTLPTINNQVWNLILNFTIRSIGTAGVASIVTLGEFHILKLASGTQQGFGFNTVNNTTFNTTIANTLDVTVQWSSNSALNYIYSDLFILNKIY